MSSFSKLVHVSGAALAAAALSTATIVWQTKVGIAAIKKDIDGVRKDLGGRLDRLDGRVEKDIHELRKKLNRLDRKVDLSMERHYIPVQGTARNKGPLDDYAKEMDLWNGKDCWKGVLE